MMRNNQNPQFQANQQAMGQGNLPYFVPTLGQPEPKMPTAEEFIKKVISDVKAEKEKEKVEKINPEDYNLPKCDLHPKKLSPNCRKCKKIKEQMDEIEKKKKLEKEKFNPENRLREIFKESGSNNVDENKNKKNPNAPMQMWGDATTFNMNELLRNNIKNSPYYSELLAMRSMPEIIDEITKKATHAEPWLPGHVGLPSTFFCCLYRLLTLKLTESQVREMVGYQGNTYVRCAGFLYLRYICNPEHIWEWFGKYILDEEEVCPTSNPDVIMSIGEYIEGLLTDMNYHFTIFPRIPVVTDREIKKFILIAREKRERKRKNIEHLDEFVRGVQIMALSPEDEEWHEATVVRIEGKRIRVKFANVKEKNDDADFTLELLAKQFQGEDVFVGGSEAILDLGEVMTPEDTIEYHKKFNEMEEEEPPKKDSNRMEEERPLQKQDEKRGHEDRDKKRKKGRSSSGSSSRSRSGSRNKRSKHKRDDRRKKDRKRRHRSSSSESSRSRSRDRRKKRSDRDIHSRRDKEKERDRRRDKSRRERSSSSSSSSSSSPSSSRSKGRSEPKEEKKVEKEKEKEKEKRKIEIKTKDKTDKYMEKVKQMEAESALAHSKSGYAARPTSYKTSLSSSLAKGKGGRSPSPGKKVVVVKQDGGRRDREEEKESGPTKAQPSAEALEKLKKLREQYGDASKGGASGGDRKKYDNEGPDVFKLGY